MDRNIIIGDDLGLFEHRLDGVTLLFWSYLELFVYFDQWKLYEYACLIRQQDIMFFEAFFFFDELITHSCKFAILQLGWQVLLYTEVYLSVFACSFHEVKLILVGEENKEVVGRLIMKIEDESFFMLSIILGEDESEAALN